MALNKNFYIAIFLIGSVFSILSLASDFGTDSAVTIFFLTIALILLIRLIVEFRYYRSYRAPLAAGIFLFIPSVIAIGASYVSRHPAINGQPFLNDYILFINLHLSLFHVEPLFVYANSFSLIFSPFYIVLLILLYRFYTGLYPRLFFMRKKFYKQFAMYYNIVLMGLISFIWVSTNWIELFELIFVFTSIVFIVRTYVFKIVLVPVRVVPSRSRRTTPRRSYTSSTGNQQTHYQPQRTTPARTQAIERNRNPTPTRQAPVRSSTPARQPTVTHAQVRSHHVTTPPRGRIEVVEGIPVGSTTKSTKNSKVNRENVKDMIPNSQNLTQDDFRCIFCYELPTKSSDQVVICPNCKKPAHFPEYQKWTSYSNFCSYCNQDIGNRTPKRLSGKNYKNIINTVLKK